MKRFTNILEWIEFRKQLSGGLGFVPTMGAIHEGHLSLVKRSLEENPFTMVSIFVNPTQFNSKSDLENYPIDIEQDLKQLENLGVDFVLTPDFSELYPDDYKYKVSENSLSHSLCGKNRPGHFDGVLTVVMKLFNIVRPQRAYLGEKDYQQLQLVKSMAQAFFMGLEVIACATVREEDGLAMSSRNRLLSAEERKLAVKFPQVLSSIENVSDVRHTLEREGFQVDYVEEINGRRFGAVHLGEVRLIDNVQLP